MDAGRLVGIFTDRDAVLKVAGRPTGPLAMREVMTRDPVIVRDDDSVAIAIHKMAVGGFRHVPSHGQADRRDLRQGDLPHLAEKLA